ncbi:MAG: amidophosphoribosyltransferase [Chloroflexi bacterium]|nr:amidophosphoribosyltransferase [Chloroflexota bacterium]
MAIGRWLPDVESDAPREACGVIGAYLPGSTGDEAAQVAFYGLFALQHRGQESAGIAAADGRTLRNFTNQGLVSNVFRQEDLQRLPGHIAIGHTRYSTTGSSSPLNAQPIVSKGPRVELALAHNGNAINAAELRQRLLDDWGVTCTTGTDSEVITHLLAWAPGDSWEEKTDHLMRSVKGAYSLVVCTADTLLGIRDPLGVRPLCVGRIEQSGWILASESCALDHVGAQFVREVEPGETVVINRSGLRSIPSQVPEARKAHCIFEHIYFARPDSILDGRLTHVSRTRMGQMLARAHPADADIVIPVPESANSAAIGYAQESGIPFSYGLIKNRYMGRTFIEPDQRFRELGVRNKFNPLPEVLSGKSVVVVDDSIVRGTTTPRIVALLRKAGAREVHVRVCAPPIIDPCFFGVDMATKAEFIASGRSIPDICREIGADSLGYLTVDQLHESVSGDPSGKGFCDACFTGRYPIPVQLQLDKLSLERTLPLTDTADTPL